VARRRSAAAARPSYELPEPEVVVVVRPEAGLRTSVAGMTADAADTKPIEKVLGAKASLRPLFGTSEQRLRFEASSIAAVAGAAPPDLSVFYRCESSGQGRNLEQLTADLLAVDVVEAAYVKPPAEPAQLNDMTPAPEDAPPLTPDFTTRQGYLDPAPGGIDARYSWTRPGGRGTGVGVIDVEGAWRFGHEDLLANQGGVIGGTPSTDLGWRNHGTAVLGEFSGDVNGLGVTGICPDANVRGISIFGGLGSAAAIRQAANALTPGDIILIELHRPGPRHAFETRNDQLGYIAVEWWPDDFAAIQYATGRGVIVVEAGGNGAENLDDGIYNTRPTGFPSSWSNPFNRANRDSGAIVVGAGAPPPGTHGQDHGPDRSRLDFSNFGALVDAQGWGREVTSCGYGDLQGGLSEDEWYTDRFSGTSSASPIVVGALGALQGVARAAGAPVTPAQARSLLRSTGSPQQDAPARPSSQRIGNRPDLRQLIGRITKAKELKAEKVERKELKREKAERKELKVEKLELKERKPEFEKQFLLEKLAELRRGWGFPPPTPGSLGPAQQFAGEAPVEERLAALEAAFEELRHFIAAELRPDLGGGALTEEYDLEDEQGL
jgi:Subtilase family